jgi:hypothetical protein
MLGRFLFLFSRGTSKSVAFNDEAAHVGRAVFGDGWMECGIEEYKEWIQADVVP